ncbi:hypothetical protein BYT27DRAFT_7244510 [Phlegmacium glaucopus]|nr:hypothetical protein BYT27DRAFT_7244510 [Phlegmacium glaucopus]
MFSTKIVASVPVEIWHQCWELTQHADLKVLSRTCHLFRDICLPLLFTNLSHELTVQHLRWPYWEFSSVTMLRYSMNIKRIAASSKLAALPRRWQVSDMGSFDTDVPDENHKLLNISQEIYRESVSLALPAFTGLRGIEISGIGIGEDILNALNKLPALESLTCKFTKFSCYSITPLLRVREFTLIHSGGLIDTSLDIVSSNFLERLTLEHYYIGSILKSLYNQGPYHYISDLSLGGHYSDIPTLFDFFQLCPQLRNLVLSYFDTTVSMDLPCLHTSVIPHLQSFSGDQCLAKAIIPGHPVEIVSIQQRKSIDTQEVVMILKSISQSTLPIRSLCLSSMWTDPMIITFIREYFPYITYLRLAFITRFQDSYALPRPVVSIFDPVITQDEAGGNPANSPYTFVGFMDMLCLDKISLPSAIQEIQILLGGTSGKLTTLQYRSYFTKLSDLYPSLTIVVLDKNYWVKQSNGHWVDVERQDGRLSQFVRE